LTKLSNCQYNEQIVNKFKFTLADIMEHVGKKIRQFRLLKGFSQQELADLIHKGRPLISHIENTGKVNHSTLLSICKALQITPEHLTSVSEEPFKEWNSIDSTEKKLLKAEVERLKNEMSLKDEMIRLMKAHIKELTGKGRK